MRPWIHLAGSDLSLVWIGSAVVAFWLLLLLVLRVWNWLVARRKPVASPPPNPGIHHPPPNFQSWPRSRPLSSWPESPKARDYIHRCFNE